MELDILTREPSLDWTEDDHLYNSFKAWRKGVEMMTSGIALKKEPKEFICNCIKAWSGETGHTHIEAVSLMGDNANTTK